MMRWIHLVGELALMCWFVSLGVEAMAQRAMLWPIPSPFRLREFHHAYLGVGLVILGFFLHSIIGNWIQVLGIIATADDTWQHQVQTLTDRRNYRSPLHELFGRTLWRVPGIPALVRILDRWWLAGVVLALLLLWLLG